MAMIRREGPDPRRFRTRTCDKCGREFPTQDNSTLCGVCEEKFPLKAIDLGVGKPKRVVTIDLGDVVIQVKAGSYVRIYPEINGHGEPDVSFSIDGCGEAVFKSDLVEKDGIYYPLPL